MVIKMLSGLPGSGKTTLAREAVKASGGMGRVNRDDLRAMLFDSEWTGRREQIVIDCEKAIAKVLLDHRNSVIVDDTNLSAKHKDMWSGFARAHEAKFEVQKVDTSIEECRARDSDREKKVGQSVIDRMALYNGLIEWGEKQIVLVDLDGTLADLSKREHYVQGPGRKDWNAFFSEVSNDDPVDIVIRWVKELAKEFTICIVSGRPDTYWFDTRIWLWENEVPYDYIFMRSGSFKGSDVEVKSEILKHLPKEKIWGVLDDRPVVIREVWKANNIKVYPVRGAVDEF